MWPTAWARVAVAPERAQCMPSRGHRAGFHASLGTLFSAAFPSDLATARGLARCPRTPRATGRALGDRPRAAGPRVHEDVGGARVGLGQRLAHVLPQRLARHADPGPRRSGCDALSRACAAELRAMAAARDVTEAADQGEGNAAARPSPVIRAA